MGASTRSLVRFLLFSVVGFGGEVLPAVDRHFVIPFIHYITAASGAVIVFFGGAVAVIGDVLQSPGGGFAVRVDNGCSGLEAVILIWSAVLAFPASWRLRLLGVFACSAAVLGLNVVRIISLFYLGQYSLRWFEWAHLYAWDILIMADGVIVVFLWIRFALARQSFKGLVGDDHKT